MKYFNEIIQSVVVLIFIIIFISATILLRYDVMLSNYETRIPREILRLDRWTGKVEILTLHKGEYKYPESSKKGSN